jgi:FlaG/FlaF family flagellin (archaellin)
VGHVRPVQPRRSARSARQAPAGLARDLAAVSPVIGSVLILVITVLGIAGVLYWGAPMIERIQVQNAQAAMVGEFEDLRDSSRELSVPDH